MSFGFRITCGLAKERCEFRRTFDKHHVEFIHGRVLIAFSRFSAANSQFASLSMTALT